MAIRWQAQVGALRGRSQAPLIAFLGDLFRVPSIFTRENLVRKVKLRKEVYFTFKSEVQTRKHSYQHHFHGRIRCSYPYCTGFYGVVLKLPSGSFSLPYPTQ